VSVPESRFGSSLPLVSGALLFGVIQTWLFQTAAPIAGVAHSGWFLNSSRSVGTVALTFVMSGLLVGLIRRNALREAAWLAGGATLAMLAVLVSIGGGNLFPIVVVLGTTIVAGVTIIGAGAGTLIAMLLGGDRGTKSTGP
jgi:hypothetical protein